MKHFIYNVPSYATGGVESLYQLCDGINMQGGDAYIVHMGDDFGMHLIPEQYRHYNLKVAREVEDSANNVLILGEIFTGDIYKFPQIQKCIWWLSVDNNKGAFTDFADENILHLYQSYYALDFLRKNNVRRHLPLFDYIYESPNKMCSTKQDIVCYNPAKDMEITQHIIKHSNGIKFVPLAGMSREQVYNTLDVSKLYIDFGNHPGRDRFPREAILNDCMIVVGDRGSAHFYDDVVVRRPYCLDEIGPLIGSQINALLDGYDTMIKDFALYKRVVMKQREEFFNQCKIFLG